MQNPWHDLPKQPDFVLSADRAAVAEFNSGANDDHRLHLELLPDPFLGRPDTPVVLLNLNPGFSPKDSAAQADPYFAQTSWANLLHVEQRYPFYLLDPKNDASDGSAWWTLYLGSLLERFGAEHVAQSVLCVEFFPYHSARYQPLGVTLQSQHYSFGLVRQAIERNALILVLRSSGNWIEAVPELATYDRLYRLRNSQRVWVTEGNCPDGYPEIVRALRE